MSLFNPEGVENNTAGVYNSLYIAEAWCNWGILGLIIAPIWVGMIIQIIYLFFIKSKKSPLLCGMFSYFSLNIPVTGGINDFIYNEDWVRTIFVLLFFYIFALFLKQFGRLQK